MRHEANSAHLQGDRPVRLAWGGGGLRYYVGGGAERLLAVVVDVLSFSTAVSVAVDKGIVVHPYRWRDAGAKQYAQRIGAALATQRSDQRAADAPGALSLSPASIMAATQAPSDLVLPSPNGSTVAAVLAEAEVEVVAGCFRNARAVAEYARAHVDAGGAVIVVPCGERWPDGTLRVADEDLWAAGAILSVFTPEERSVEAETAVDAFRVAKRALPAHLKRCASGKELISRGYGDDVLLAAQLSCSPVVPKLSDHAFRALRPTPASS